MHAHTICVEIQMWHVILPMATTGEEVYSLLSLQPNRWAHKNTSLRSSGWLPIAIKTNFT